MLCENPDSQPINGIFWGPNAPINVFPLRQEGGLPWGILTFWKIDCQNSRPWAIPSIKFLPWGSWWIKILFLPPSLRIANENFINDTEVQTNCWIYCCLLANFLGLARIKNSMCVMWHRPFNLHFCSNFARMFIVINSWFILYLFAF